MSFQDSRINDAIQLLEKMLKRYDWSRFWEPILAVKGYYVLGTAYQEAGMKDKAIENLQTFLELWKDADPELEEVPDARKRLHALAGRST